MNSLTLSFYETEDQSSPSSKDPCRRVTYLIVQASHASSTRGSEIARNHTLNAGLLRGSEKRLLLCNDERVNGADENIDSRESTLERVSAAGVQRVDFADVNAFRTELCDSRLL